ncbi:MAG: ABC transporter permease [Pseudomonadota bacterium]|jgi:ABC-type polysaccharide/polyol phosphate export permease
MPSAKLWLALQDLWAGTRAIHVWPMLGWLEVKQRYRRSTIGPFWLTLSTAAMVAGMGPLYSKLFGQPVSGYFTYLAVSLVLWTFVSALVNEACTTFINAEGYIKQVRLPLTVHVLRVVWKNLIILGHNAVIVVVALFFFGPGLDWHVVLVPLGVLLIAVNGVWLGILLGLVCARFRDIPQIVASLMQVAMFLTPVFWPAEMLGRNRWAAEVNPLFHFLEIVRRPLLGQSPDALSWAAALAVTAGGYLVTLAFFQRYRARIAYWV